MTSIKARLNRSRRGSDGTYPLVFQLIHARVKRELHTDYRLLPAEFDNLQEKAVTDGRNHQRSHTIRCVNTLITRVKQELERIVHSLDERGEYTTADIVRAYKTRHDMGNFFTYAETKIVQLRNAGRNGTANNYLNGIRLFRRFVGSDHLPTDSLTKSLIEDYIAFLKQRHNSPNTIVFYVKQIRALYNKAADEGFVHSPASPFARIKLKGEKTPKRAITVSELNRIASLRLDGEHSHKALALDVFLFSLFSCGMSFVDICNLKKDNIRGNVLTYRRQKTGQLIEMKIEPPLRKLLQKYKDSQSDYLLPMLRADDSYEGYRYIQRRLNKRIRELGKMAGFDFPLTFYVARHTWATLAHEKGFPISAISAGMGHTSESTTRIYLANLNHRMVDKTNRAVINCWNNRKPG